MDYHTIIATLAIPGVTFLGCVTAYMYSEQKGIKSSKKTIRGLFPKRSPEFYNRIDFILSALIGTCIGVILYSPTTAYQALAAGLGWTAAFNIMKSDKTPAAEPAVDN